MVAPILCCCLSTFSFTRSSKIYLGGVFGLDIYNNHTVLRCVMYESLFNKYPVLLEEVFEHRYGTPEYEEGTDSIINVFYTSPSSINYYVSSFSFGSYSAPNHPGRLFYSNYSDYNYSFYFELSINFKCKINFGDDFISLPLTATGSFSIPGKSFADLAGDADSCGSLVASFVNPILEEQISVPIRSLFSQHTSMTEKHGYNNYEKPYYPEYTTYSGSIITDFSFEITHNKIQYIASTV